MDKSETMDCRNLVFNSEKRMIIGLCRNPFREQKIIFLIYPLLLLFIRLWRISPSGEGFKGRGDHSPVPTPIVMLLISGVIHNALSCIRFLEGKETPLKRIFT